jgi:hypothetical protein
MLGGMPSTCAPVSAKNRPKWYASILAGLPSCAGTSGSRRRLTVPTPGRLPRRMTLTPVPDGDILECIQRLRQPEVGVVPSGRASRPLKAASVWISRADLLRLAGKTGRSWSSRGLPTPATRASASLFRPNARERA